MPIRHFMSNGFSEEYYFWAEISVNPYIEGDYISIARVGMGFVHIYD